MTFIEELKRRNVVRVGLLYAVASWVILQVADILFEAFELPPSATRLVIIVLLIGFPIALIISWVYELTPEGIKKESEVQADASIPRSTGRKMNVLLSLLLAIAVLMLLADRIGPAPIPDAGDQSIAVLPFANRSANADDIYFVDGIHDDILTQLAKIDSLTVTSRTSVERFRDTDLSLPEIAEALSVRHVLEGGIQRAGERVRINLQLINAATDEHLWANTYVRELTASNLFAVQEDIAVEVTKALRATLQVDEKAALNERPTESIEAYDLYLLGRFHQKKRTEADLTLALDYFEKATQIDEDYVPALSGLADTNVLLVGYGNMDGDVAFPAAEAAVERALAIDDANAEVWASLGLLRMQQLRADEAEKALLKALELDDKNAQAWLWYGGVLGFQYRYADSLAAYESAYALEPMSIPVNNNLSNVYYKAGDFSRTRLHAERVGQLDPEQRLEFAIHTADSFELEGRIAAAVREYRKVLAEEPANVNALNGLGYAYLLLGDRAEAEKWYLLAERGNPYLLARTRLFEKDGDYDTAIEQLEQLLERIGNRQIYGALAELFRMSYLNGDIDPAARYLRERLAFTGGRIEIDPSDVGQFDALLVAEFLMLHGEETGLDAERGVEMVEEAHTALTALVEQGFRHPYTLGSLAIADALRGDTRSALDHIGAAIDAGGRDLSFVLNHRAFDDIRGSADIARFEARIASFIDEERARLADMTLAPYDSKPEFTPIVLARETLRGYEGYFTDGNVLMRSQIGEDGLLGITAGQNSPRLSLLPYEEDRFFTPMISGGTVEFVRNDVGEITHVQMDGMGFYDRLRIAAAPPEQVVVERDVLERYAGTFVWTRPSTTESRSDADKWIAVITVGDDGTLIIDFNNQPALTLVPFSETRFFLPGFLGTFEFEIAPGDGYASRIINRRDGREIVFNREEP